MTRLMTFLACLFTLSSAWADPKVTVLKTPDGGIQPQAVVSSGGDLHLIYFKGDPFGGDLFYLRRDQGKKAFPAPLRVNSIPGSAVAAGTVRGGQLALGKEGRVHVVWNGSGKLKSKDGSPVLYSHLKDSGTAFEPQRDLRHHTGILDGGCTIAADGTGNVLVAWHAVESGDKGEDRRQVWITRSADAGQTFSKEAAAWAEPTGACGCCSMRAHADGKGAIHMLYRSATEEVHRDIYLLSSADAGKTFRGANLHQWKINACPMSTLALAHGPQGIVAAWDTEGQVFFTTIKPGTTEFSKPQSPPAGKASKHPALAINSKGETILAWAEGTGWMKGGALAWQVFDRDGHPLGKSGRVPGGIPVWGLPTVVETEEGFLILH